MNGHFRHTWTTDAAALGTLLLLTAAAWWGLIRPTHQRSLDNTAAAIELSAERERASSIARRLAARQSELQRLRAELETYSQDCWTDHDRSRRIEVLFQTARGEGMIVEGVDPSDAERVGGRRVLPMRLAARSEFSPLLLTLRKFREAQPDVVLRTLDIVPAPTGDGQLLVNAEFLWVPSPDTATPSRPVPPAPAPGGRP